MIEYDGVTEQKVTVEHVNVGQGGRAIVGNVKTQGGRGEAQQKYEEGPHGS